MINEYAQEDPLKGQPAKKIPHRTLMIANANLNWKEHRQPEISLNGKDIKQRTYKPTIDDVVKKISKVSAVHNWKMIGVHVKYERIPNGEMKALSAAIGRHMATRSQKLVLELDAVVASYRQPNREEFVFYGQEIARKLTQLRTLCLRLRDAKMTKEGAKKFGSEMKIMGTRMVQLKNFSLSFIECEISENKLGVLVSDIGNYFTRLQTLRLVLPYNSLTDNVALCILKAGFGKNLCQLVQLDLICCWSLLTFHGMKMLASAIGRLPKLKLLRLDLSW